MFDSGADLKAANGECSDKIYKCASDPNSLTLLYEWVSFVYARAYAQSPELKAAIEKAGVVGLPYFLKEA